MCGYFCIGFIDFKLKGKGFLDYTFRYFLDYFFQTNMKRMIK